MKKYNKLQLLSGLYQETESILEKAIAEWQMLPSEILLTQPEPGKWSAAQCLEHLNSYGRYYLPQIQHAIQAAEPILAEDEKMYNSSWFGNYFTNMMLPEYKGKPTRKISSPKNHRPAVSLDSTKVLAEFIDQQENLLHYLNEAENKSLKRIKIPISISRFIKLPLGDTFLFVIAHNYRHIRQAERALKKAKILGKPLKSFEFENMGWVQQP